MHRLTGPLAILCDQLASMSEASEARLPTKLHDYNPPANASRPTLARIEAEFDAGDEPSKALLV